MSGNSPKETDPLIDLKSSGQGDQESAVTANNAADGDELASVGARILALAIPAAGALLIDPLMTLADTAFVGRFSGAGADPLAGMGSAAALLTFSFYLFNFLCTATTPLVASQRAAGRPDQAVAVGGQALSLALTLGSLLTVVLWTFGPSLLTVMGTSITGQAANDYAWAFLSVRALAAPAVFCMEASTGVLRGYLDTQTPIVILVAANLVNLVLDVILIAILGLGPMGAAIATTTAEWMSAALFLLVLAGKIPSANSELGRKDDNAKDQETLSIVPLLELPSWQQVKPLIVASSSVFLRALVLQLSLSAAAAMAARADPSVAAASVAAHQIGIQLWLLCSFFCDSLAAASQGLVADALGRQDGTLVRAVSKTVFAYSAILGCCLAAILGAGGLVTTALYDLFTRDEATRVALSQIMPLLVLAQPLNALVFAADGVLQGASEFPFQARAMVVSGVTGVATFWVLGAGGDADVLLHVWAALVALQLMRGLTSLYKLVQRDGPIQLLASS